MRSLAKWMIWWFVSMIGAVLVGELAGDLFWLSRTRETWGLWKSHGIRA